LGHTCVSRRALMRKNGVILDFRFYDVREARSKESIDRYLDKLVEAKRVNFFLLFPWSLQLIGASPEIEYVRLLEGRVWQGYLGRIGRYFGCLGAEKIVTYQWRSYQKSKPILPVSVDRPFRVFADFSPEASPLGLWGYRPYVTGVGGCHDRIARHKGILRNMVSIYQGILRQTHSRAKYCWTDCWVQIIQRCDHELHQCSQDVAAHSTMVVWTRGPLVKSLAPYPAAPRTRIVPRRPGSLSRGRSTISTSISSLLKFVDFSLPDKLLRTT